MALAQQFRCRTYQNQTLRASHAGLAPDLQNQIRKNLGHSRSDQDLVDYQMQPHGNFVLYRLLFKAMTVSLWLAPFLSLAGGVALLELMPSRRRMPVMPFSDINLPCAAQLLRAPLSIKETR